MKCICGHSKKEHFIKYETILGTRNLCHLCIKDGWHISNGYDWLRDDHEFKLDNLSYLEQKYNEQNV